MVKQLSTKKTVKGGYPVDTIVTYSCNHGYKQIHTTRYCHPAADWFGDIPTCHQSNQYYLALYLNNLNRV